MQCRSDPGRCAGDASADVPLWVALGGNSAFFGGDTTSSPAVPLGSNTSVEAGAADGCACQRRKRWMRDRLVAGFAGEKPGRLEELQYDYEADIEKKRPLWNRLVETNVSSGATTATRDGSGGFSFEFE